MTTTPHHHGHHPHGHHHDTDGHTPDLDWGQQAEMLIGEGELHTPAVREVAAWLRQLLGPRAATVRRLLDVGSGPGVNTALLAEAFPAAEAVAVDGAAPLLAHVQARAAQLGLADRVRTLEAELPDGFAALGEADLIWSSRAVHHLGDQQAALDALAGALRPGGLLAVAEGGLPVRFLPRDLGIGRPGLQVRLDAVVDEWFAAMRAGLPGATAVAEHWPGMLAAAGLTPTGSRTFLTEVPAPLPAPAREHVYGTLARRREQLGDVLDADDLATVDRLLDRDAPDGLLRRPDAFYLTATTVHTAVAGG